MAMPEELLYKLRIGRSNIDGRGCFTEQSIGARVKIGNLGGEIITEKEARKRVLGKKKVAMVEFGDGLALDASRKSNALRYVNHSCVPNTYMRCCYGRVEFYTLRKLKKGEELTCNYGDTHHDGKLVCKCGAPGCRGSI